MNQRSCFLDEPTAGVDVELRKDMWNTVAKLKGQGVTIILTTHYIEEAEGDCRSYRCDQWRRNSSWLKTHLP